MKCGQKVQPMTTIETVKLVETSVDLANRLGMKDRAKRMRQAKERLETDACRIAVIGQFKAGKSTLINKIFLKDDVLFTDVLEATAVPTHIEYASKRRLEIRPYRVAVEVIEQDGVKKTVQTTTLDELPPRIIESPKPNDIKAATSAETEDGRAALAMGTANVLLQWPASNLKGLIVTDTPGINSMNEAVMETTYRVIPEADLAVFVTSATQLSDVELRFLRGAVFDKNVNRCMVVINYDPFYNPGANVPSIKKAIRAQLAGIGRPHVPVEAVDLRDAKRTLMNSFREAIDSIKAHVLNTMAPDDYSVAALERKMIAFIRDNALPAKTERVCTVLRNELAGAKTECTVELAAAGKTEEEIAALKHKVDAEERKFRAEYERLGDAFLDDLKGVQNAHYQDLASGLDSLCVSLTSKLEECKNVTELRLVLDTSVSRIQPDVEGMMLQTSARTRDRLTELANKYETTVDELAKPWTKVVADGLNIDPGVIGRLPQWLVLIVDIIISNWVLPGGIIWAVILRWIASKIPLIKLLLPQTLFTKGVALYMTTRMRKEFETLKMEVKDRIAATYADAQERIHTGWLAQADTHIESIRRPLDEAAKRRGDPKRIALVEDALKLIASLESTAAVS